jgi:hypothetical protein
MFPIDSGLFLPGSAVLNVARAKSGKPASFLRDDSGRVFLAPFQEIA